MKKKYFRRILANVPKVKNLHIYSEECGGVWLELLALNIRNLPDLTTLILNCWEAKKLCCPDDIDDVLPHITSRAERLRSLSLGPGVQPTLNGLRDILNSSNLQIIDAYLCATLDPNETIGPLIEMISRSSVKILKTKVHTSLKQLALLLERFAMTGHEENSKLETKKTSTECLWETESDVVLKSLLVKGLSLFRVRKAPLTTPISRVTKLRPRMTKPSENVKCHIPSLCGPNGPIFTCGTCVTNPKEPCCDLQRLGTDLITDFDCLNISAYSSRAYDKQWQNCQTECNKNGCTAMLAKYVLWVSWNDAELEKHFVRTTDKSINKAPASNKLHWIRFISDDPTPIRN